MSRPCGPPQSPCWERELAASHQSRQHLGLVVGNREPRLGQYSGERIASSIAWIGARSQCHPNQMLELELLGPLGRDALQSASITSSPTLVYIARRMRYVKPI